MDCAKRLTSRMLVPSVAEFHVSDLLFQSCDLLTCEEGMRDE